MSYFDRLLGLEILFMFFKELYVRIMLLMSRAMYFANKQVNLIYKYIYVLFQIKVVYCQMTKHLLQIYKC